jgi:hypothetical protein
VVGSLGVVVMGVLRGVSCRAASYVVLRHQNRPATRPKLIAARPEASEVVTHRWDAEIGNDREEVIAMGAPQRPAGKAGDDYVSTEELVRRSGVQPLRTADDLAASTDPFESDEEYQAFLDDLYASRRANQS